MKPPKKPLIKIPKTPPKTPAIKPPKTLPPQKNLTKTPSHQTPKDITTPKKPTNQPQKPSTPQKNPPTQHLHLTKHKKFDIIKRYTHKYKSEIRFLLVGGTNFLIDLALFTLLANLIGLPTIPAHLTSTIICIAISFFLNYHFVWQSQKSQLQTAPKFLAVSFFSAWIVQTIIIWTITSIFDTTDLINIIAKISATVVSTLTNYLGYKFIFK